AATRQAAVALDRARLDARARLAQLDAETNQLRAAMFSSVTHDLRTPLASIKAGVTSLLDVSTVHDATQQRELLLTILEETDRLNRLVGNILDLARIRAGALIPRRVPTDVQEVTEAVLARMRNQLDRVRVELQIPEELPEIAADPMQLDQVLTNLVENAARHSPPSGAVRIHIAREGEAVRVRVSDEGPGIPLAQREKVFEPFYRGREEPERPGSGLGLSIARAVVTAHGGRIWVEETGGGGTVLVVDDEPQIRRALRTSLEAHGYTVETVGTGDEGVVAAAGQHPELILLDLGLPDMDGTEVIKRVRAFSEVPIIVLSVREGQGDKVAALDAGADDYVTKPFGM